MPKVIGISGSERLKGNTEQFIQRALDVISDYGIETELITLADKKIKGGCTGCIWCRANRAECCIKDDFMPIWNKMYEADGIIVGSPVYWGSATAKLKAVLERAGT
ncbi:MAG: flavodoxin family protein, partial [Theionarchaea archaeon]|nr:flavodoxin family protein [Theionarchaea archaeon]